MSQAKLDDAIKTARQHHQAGRLEEAEQIYRQVLKEQPSNADALHLLGVLAGQAGRLDAAADLIQRAIAISSTNSFFYGNLGNVLRNLNRFDAAIAAHRQAIALKPDYAIAHCNLGNSLKDAGNIPEAIACYRRAIELEPDQAVGHNNLGIALKELGQPEESIGCYHQAIALKPDYAEAHNNLGFALQASGQLDGAIASYRQAIQLKPEYADAHYNLGTALQQRGQLDEAITSYRHAIRLKPDLAEAHSNLGIALADKGQFGEAAAAYRQVIQFKADNAEAHSNLGNALAKMGEVDEAVESYRQAIRMKPDYADAYCNLGLALGSIGQHDKAIAAYRKAIQLKPDLAQAHINWGAVLYGEGHLDEAIDHFRQALANDPRLASVHSNLVYALHYHPGYDAKGINGELRRWNEQHAESLKNLIQPHANDHNPMRPLRIGYVSADFRNHACAHFLLPLFRHHDRQQFEITCYAEVADPDKVTQRLREQVRHWHKIEGRTDAEVSALIRENQIDILVDLSVHTAKNRLLVFAQKPAPVQVTWMLPSSTGLDTVDYRLTDPNIDPPGLNDAYYSEHSIRLPETFWCYDPFSSEQASNLPPCAERGFVTFGCLNNFCKVNDAVLSLWSRVLVAVSGSHLMLLVSEGSSRTRILDRLGGNGIGPDRVEFVAKQPRLDYLRTFNRIDIALDTFPYNGHTTSFDTLWMGVPVITLVGSTACGRVGLSQLTNLGLTELVARMPQEYVQIATDLANDVPRLTELRRTLRSRMRASPLMDAPRFARNVEAAYRQIWRSWCSTEEGR